MLFADLQSDAVIADLVQKIAILIGLIVTALIVQVGNVLVSSFNTWLSRINSAKLDHNTEITKGIAPAVAEQVGSATLHAEEKAEQKAEGVARTAVMVAAEGLKVAKIDNANLAEKIAEVATALKGEDGTCWTGRFSKLEKRVGGMEGDIGDIKELLGTLIARRDQPTSNRIGERQ